jgi:hypothetical protein
MRLHPQLAAKLVHGNPIGSLAQTNDDLAPHLSRKRTLLAGLLRWITDGLVADVPSGDAMCEFDCRKTQCTRGEWATCSRRLAQASGELSPTTEDDEARTRAVG